MAPVSCKLGTPDTGPRKIESEPDDDLFHHRLDNLIDMRHELVRLSELIGWQVFESQGERCLKIDVAPPLYPYDSLPVCSKRHPNYRLARHVPRS